MYDINIEHQINNAPWEIKLEERCRYIRQMIREGYHITMIIYEYPDTSTFRYRGYNIYQAMQQSKQWKVVYFYRHELMYAKNFLGETDIVTISRVKWNHELQLFIDTVKQMKIPVLFDVDDRIYDLNYLPLVTNTLAVGFESNPEVAYDFWFAQISRIEMTARQVDGYIGTNPYLCNTFRERFGKKGYVIPNFLNNEQVQVSQLCVENKKKQQKKKPFVIGYFSGTPSHINDFKTIYKELMQLLLEYDDIVLEVVGFMEFPAEMNELIASGRVRFSSLFDFVKLQELVAAVDVNIVPLVVNDFTNCKSELKFFEAAIVDTITCAARSYTYEQAIEHGVNGFLCNPTQWYTTIKKIYLDEYDTERIIQNAHQHVMEQYYGEKIVKQIETVYETVMKELTNGK